GGQTGDIGEDSLAHYVVTDAAGTGAQGQGAGRDFAGRDVVGDGAIAAGGERDSLGVGGRQALYCTVDSDIATIAAQGGSGEIDGVAADCATDSDAAGRLTNGSGVSRSQGNSTGAYCGDGVDANPAAGAAHACGGEL